MKHLLVLSLWCFSLYALDNDSNSTRTQEDSLSLNEDIVVVKDKSGLSDDELRKKAKSGDAKRKARVSVEDVVKSIDESGTVDLSKIQQRWEELSPTPHKCDWVKTKSGEWFKGEIKGLFDDKLEFDSDEVGLYSFKFDDVVEIKSYHIINVNIEDVASFSGILRLKNNKITIIQGDNSYEFEKKYIISFAPYGDKEKNLWTGKVSFSFDIRQGNSNQYDYSAKINLMRRTAVSRLTFDYLGRTSSKDDVENANDHRINEKYDRYLTRHFFWTPVFSEIYTDKYKNIDKQLTLGLGVGYTFIDTKKTTWSFSGGPAFLYTRYDTVHTGDNIQEFSPAMEISTKYEIELSKITDITFDYKLTYTDASAGKYKHHTVLVFENELTSWLDIDLTGVWDYILEPVESDSGVIPERSDFQILVGLGIEF